MVIRRWTPYGELRWLQHNMDQFRRAFGAPAGLGRPEPQSWAIPLDVIREGDEFIVQASLPGVNPEDIGVSIENDVLTIRGRTAGEKERQEGNYLVRERRSGAFHRAVRLPDALNLDQVQPRYDNGVLTIAFPWAEAKQGRQLTVAVGNPPESPPAGNGSEPA